MDQWYFMRCKRSVNCVFSGISGSWASCSVSLLVSSGISGVAESSPADLSWRYLRKHKRQPNLYWPEISLPSNPDKPMDQTPQQRVCTSPKAKIERKIDVSFFYCTPDKPPKPNVQNNIRKNSNESNTSNKYNGIIRIASSTPRHTFTLLTFIR